jgi:hypothetical protein
MVNILNPQFLKWNTDNSEEHFDHKADPTSWETGAETYLNIFNQEMFSMSTYSLVKKEYQLDTEGVRIIKNEQKSQEMPTYDGDDNEVMGEQHEIEIDWLITKPKGHVFITVEGDRVGIEWADRKITDLHGNVARLLGSDNSYRVEEILSPQEEETLIEIKRLARLRDMSKGEMREMLNQRMLGLSR